MSGTWRKYDLTAEPEAREFANYAVECIAREGWHKERVLAFLQNAFMAGAALRAQPTECEPNGPVVITGGTFAGLKGRAVMHDTYRQTLVEDDTGFRRWYPDFWVEENRE